MIVGVLAASLISLVGACCGASSVWTPLRPSGSNGSNYRSSRVPSEHLVDLDANLLGGFEVALNEVVRKELLGECLIRRCLQR